MVDLPSLRLSATSPAPRPAITPASATKAGDGETRTAGPDLVIDSIYPSNPFPMPGDAVFFQVGVRNQGDAPAGPFSVQLRGAFSPEQRLQGLNPGQRAFLPYMGPAYAQFGGQALSVEALVDPRNEVAESNEGNNFQWSTVWVQQPPMPPPMPPYPPHPAAPTTLIAE